jgi:ClpP class serine protease
MYKDRLGLYRHLEKMRKSKVIVYVTGDRRGLETQIHPEILDFFIEHLDLIDGVKKISLFLYTRGGSTSASWSIPNLIRQFCESFEVIVPSKAHSGGTLICLGADNIVMTKQAALGPIDPSVNSPLNPQIPGAPPMARASVSVEAI